MVLLKASLEKGGIDLFHSLQRMSMLDYDRVPHIDLSSIDHLDGFKWFEVNGNTN